MSDHTLMSTDNAMIWAEEFCRIFNVGAHSEGGAVMPTADQEGLMVTWFANAIEAGKGFGISRLPKEGPWHAFLHFYHLDKSNAAFHCSTVRFSPVTFRLAEFLRDSAFLEAILSEGSELSEVLSHLDQYEEDRGR